jgi:outer membrane protein assembly factor BamB
LFFPNYTAKPIPFDAKTGNQLFSFQDTNKKSAFNGPGSISNGVLYQGNGDGILYVFGP